MLPAVPASYHFQTTFKNSKKLNITNIVQLSKPSNMRSLENSQSSLNSLCTLSPLLSGTDAPPRSWPVVPASYHFLKTFKNSKKSIYLTLSNSQNSQQLSTLSNMPSGIDAPPPSWPVVPASYHFLKTFKNSKKLNITNIVQLSMYSESTAFRDRCSATFVACSASIIPFSENIQEL